MAAALSFVPARVPLVDLRTGHISREWLLLLQGLFERVGGPLGSSTTDLTTSAFEDSGIEETKAQLYALRDELGALPPVVMLPADEWMAMQQQAAELAAQVAEMGKQIDALRQVSGVVL